MSLTPNIYRLFAGLICFLLAGPAAVMLAWNGDWEMLPPPLSALAVALICLVKELQGRLRSQRTVDGSQSGNS